MQKSFLIETFFSATVFCWAISPAVGAEMSTIIEEVAANEALYRSVDLQWSYNYERNNEQNKAAPSPGLLLDRVTLQEESVRYTVRTVLQGDNFYVQRDGEGLSAEGKRFEYALMHKFDGNETHSIFEGSIGNISPRRKVDETLLLPHMACFHAMRYCMPLSTFLSGTEAMLADADADWQPQFGITTREEPDGTASHLACRVVYVEVSVGQSRHHGWRLFLAKERNLIPVKVDGYTYRDSDVLPKYTATVDSFTELAPGMWFPKNITTRKFRFPRDKSSEPVERARAHITIDKVAFSPERLDDLFSSFHFPDGMPVYVLDENDTIVSNSVVGAPSRHGTP